MHRLQRVSERAGIARGDVAQQRERGQRLALVLGLARQLGQPQQPGAALEPPEGIGVSSRSLRRVISASPSEAVEKKPPCSGSCEAGDHLLGEL